MNIAREPVEKSITIKALISRKTGLILAICDEHKGLSVFGNSLEEIEQRLPGAIRDHFEMLGFDVEDVRVIDSSDDDSVFGSLPASICAQALLLEKGSRDTR